MIENQNKFLTNVYLPVELCALSAEICLCLWCIRNVRFSFSRNDELKNDLMKKVFHFNVFKKLISSALFWLADSRKCIQGNDINEIRLFCLSLQYPKIILQKCSETFFNSGVSFLPGVYPPYPPQYSTLSSLKGTGSDKIKLKVALNVEHINGMQQASA